MAANAKSTLTIQARRTEFKEAIRIQQSLLAPIEKRFLIWLAHRTPPAINPT
ncbi:MAG: hypothetical protein ACREAC_14305 [Blastocatellia bacterium]